MSVKLVVIKTCRKAALSLRPLTGWRTDVRLLVTGTRDVGTEIVPTIAVVVGVWLSVEPKLLAVPAGPVLK